MENEPLMSSGKESDQSVTECDDSIRIETELTNLENKNDLTDSGIFSTESVEHVEDIKVVTVEQATQTDIVDETETTINSPQDNHGNGFNSPNNVSVKDEVKRINESNKSSDSCPVNVGPTDVEYSRKNDTSRTDVEQTLTNDEEHMHLNIANNHPSCFPKSLIHRLCKLTTRTHVTIILITIVLTSAVTIPVTYSLFKTADESEPRHNTRLEKSAVKEKCNCNATRVKFVMKLTVWNHTVSVGLPINKQYDLYQINYDKPTKKDIVLENHGTDFRLKCDKTNSVENAGIPEAENTHEKLTIYEIAKDCIDKKSELVWIIKDGTKDMN